MTATDAALRGRDAAESLMLDSCTVQRPGVDVTDPDGVVVTPLVEVYDGKCKVQASDTQPASPVAGGHAFTVERLQLHFPALSSLRTGDVATITASLLDPSLVGLTFRLDGAARGSQRTAARWNVELVTA